MVVGFVLPAVQQQDAYVAIAVDAVKPSVLSGEIVAEAVGKNAARLVVAAGEQNRGPGGEERHRSVEVCFEKLLPALDAARHIAVEGHESQFRKIHALAEPGHVVGFAVDVVQHDKRAAGTRLREGPKFISPAAGSVGIQGFSVGDVVDIGPRLHLLRKDAVTVIGPGLQSPDPDRMQGPASQFAARDGLVIPRLSQSRGVQAVGGRRLDPRKRRLAGGPDHRHPVVRHVAQVRTMCNSKFLGDSRPCEGHSRQYEKQFFHSIFSRLPCPANGSESPAIPEPEVMLRR